MKILVVLGLGFGGYLLYRKTRQLPIYDINGRRFGLYVSNPSPTTLVVLLHGLGGSVHTLTGRGWERIADQYGAILAFPEALPGPTGKRAWNHRRGQGPYFTPAHDDVQAIDDVIARIRQHYPSVRRLVVVGYSNGGGMAYRYASERHVHGLVIMSSAIKTLSGDGQVTSYHPPSGPTPIVIFHGSRDSWRGGPSPGDQAVWAPVSEAVNAYRSANRADRPVQVSNPGVPMAWHQRWLGTASVEVVVDANRGHELPRWDWASHAWRAITPG
jgi:polyhydroxybutyrate depolymerase